MAKKEKAIYAPGELKRVRDNLGSLDQVEAQKMAQKLGGDIGYERTEMQELARQSPRQKVRTERVDVKIGDRPSRSSRRVDLARDDPNDTDTPEKRKSKVRRDLDPADDPSVPIKINYWERVKMDRCAGMSEFDIKSSSQVLYSILSPFSEVVDYVSPIFIKRRMPEYYKKIETLVVSTRSMFPRNNTKRSERIKRSAPLVYSILDTIRYWNIEKISGDLARIQANPKHAKVSDFAEILRSVYRPLFILELMNPDSHIRGAYKILYKILYIENPMDAQSKYQDLIRVALSSYFEIRRDIYYLLYPLLMKTVSSRFIPYERFFMERRNRIMAFLNITENDRLDPNMALPADDKAAKDEASEEAPPETNTENQETEEKEEQISEEEKARRDAEEAEKKALDRGLQTLEALFPKAGWDRLSSFPDLYPYFADVLDFKKGIVNIAPTDPMQQIHVLMRILEELFYGLRYVSFGAIPDPKGNFDEIDMHLEKIINNWRNLLETSLEKEYLPRLSDYVHIVEGSVEERTSVFAKRLTAELHWIKRLYFLPFYRFETLVPPPYQKNEIHPIYRDVKDLRKYLTIVAAGIEMGNRAGGAEASAPCEGIDNPWEPYVFQVPNPLSIRLEALLAPKSKNNAALVFFCLAVTVVLDYLINNDKSWAYSPNQGPLFRSVNGEGEIPLTGVDNHIDADAIFKKTIKQRQKPASE